MITLETAVQELPKVGAAYAKKLKKFGITTVQDLLFYFPQRYDDFSEIITIKSARAKLGETVCVQGRVTAIENTASFYKRTAVTEAIIQDDTAEINVVWFNQPYIAKSFKEDDYISVAGKVAINQEGLYLSNPTYERIHEDSEREDLTHTGRIVPVYAETRGLTSRWLRYIIKPLLWRFGEQIKETLPDDIIQKNKFLPIQEATWQLHFPDSFEHADAAKRRFSFEDLLLIQLHVLKEKAKLQHKKAPAFPMDEKLMKEFTDSLAFKLTDAQRKCAFQILKDLEKPFPMSRLLEGDVGSGKTVVAAMAALQVAKHGWQAAFLAPTEILAKQHFGSLCQLLKPFDISIGLMTGKDARIFRNGEPFEVSKKSFLGDLENGQVSIVLGTHSLIQKTVGFKNLGLAIVDEQHRFGVEQRSALLGKRKEVPHLLSMTATPIPRTLALTIYGDLDLSLIDEMPKNRKKIKTVVVEPSRRQEAYNFIREEVQQGKGVFVICPKIESKAKTDGATTASASSFVPQNYSFAGALAAEVKTVADEAKRLQKDVFPDLKVGMLHGKMKAPEKEKIMLEFKEGKIDILVSTSVVEVGVDVPRATIMMIEGAERFGLSQLHQFRGRVGRNDLQSYCFLLTTEVTQLNRKRLKAMEQFHTGFELAQIDLEIRGPGSLYGTQQWGVPDIAMEGLSNLILVEKTREAAKDILAHDPSLESHSLLKERLKHFQQKIHFE